MKLFFVAVVAMVVFGSALAQNPADNAFKQEVKNAIQLYKDGKLDQAITALEKLVADRPEDSDALGWMGFLYLRADKPAQAVPPLEKALAKNPNSVELLNNLGSSHLALGHGEEALPYFQKVSQLQ